MAGGGEYTTGPRQGPWAWTAGWIGPYSGAVQQVVLFSGIAGMLGALALVVSRWTWGAGSVLRRMMLGILPGIAGAFIIGVWQTDLISDSVEVFLLPFVLGIGSFALGMLVVIQLRAR